MAMQTFKGALYGGWPGFTNANPTFANTLLMDASAEKVAFVFQAPKTGTLDKCEFRTGSVTIDASSVLRVSFQNINTSGNPDGTQDQYRDITAGSVTANTWIVPGLMTSDGTDGGTKRSVTLGDWLALVIEYSTFTGSNSIQISSFTKLIYASLPYCKLFTASWTEPSANLAPVMALKYNDGTYEYVPGCYAFSALNSTGFNNSSTPDERGLKFQVPFPTRIRGAFMWIDQQAAGRAFDIVLYDAASSVLETLSVSGDYTAAFNNLRGGFFLFDTAVSISKDTVYRLIHKPTTVSSNNIQDFDVNAAAIMDCFEGGQNWHHTQRTDAGAWTDTTTKRPFFTPLFDQFDDGVGGGGGGLLTNPGMAGGMRG